MKMRDTFRRGFTLVEIMAVIGILSILMGIAIAGFSKAPKKAEQQKAQQLIWDVATALESIYQQDGVWPRRLASRGSSDGLLDQNVAKALVSQLGLSSSGSGDNLKLVGLDQFGVVTPWATDAIKQAGTSASLGTHVAGTGKTVQDHILHYALDLDGDGKIIGANVGGTSVSVRKSVIVWCCGKDGVVSPYAASKHGSGCDDVYSWQPGDTKGVQ